MKMYAEIRKRHQNGESQRHIAKDLGVSRNTVKKYCEGNSVPWERKRPLRASPILTDEVISFIRHCLDEDACERSKKQHHTAKRIYERLVDEMGFTGGESTVRLKVHELKGEIPKAFIPLEYEAGEAMQVDWGESVVYLKGERSSVNIFCARLCHSSMPFALAYHKQNEESFLDAFVKIFEGLGGVPKRVIFDNARVAVKEGFGAHAKKQEGYTALSAHYGFHADFCNIAEGHEKGLVEGLVGWTRRNIMVPVPHVDSMEELNGMLMKRCMAYEEHRIQGKPKPVGEMFREEQRELMPLPGYRFEVAKTVEARVNAYSMVRFQTNSYSVPPEYVGKMVGVKGYPEKIEIYFGGMKIAEHARCFHRNQKCCLLEHYMPLLEKRRRAIPNALPVKQNVPYEVMKKIRESRDDYSNMLAILESYRAEKRQVIEDPIDIMKVDLTAYDQLFSGMGGDAK